MAPAIGEETLEYWKTPQTKIIDYGNDTRTVITSLSPQVFWDGSNWQTLLYEDRYATDHFYLIRNSQITAEIYDYYAKYWNPNYTAVSVYDERFEVQRWLPQGQGKWDDVGAQAGTPGFSIFESANQIEVTKSFTSWAGKLNITYILRTGDRLKHRIIWESYLTDSTEYRVVLKLSGITSKTVKHNGGRELITGSREVVSPFLLFGQSDQELVLSEDLWSLGEETTGEWHSVNLQNIILDTHAQGSKADIYIGNYTLAQNEALEIDPATSTWRVSASSDDCRVNDLDHDYVWDEVKPASAFHDLGNQSGAARTADGIRFIVSGASLQGGTINSAYINYTSRVEDWTAGVKLNITGEDADNATTFSDLADYNARARTSNVTAWDFDTPWLIGSEHQSVDIKLVIQEIVDRPGFADFAIVLFVEDDGSPDGAERPIHSYDSSAANAAELIITYTPGNVAPTVGEYGASSTVYAYKYAFVNVTVQDTNGNTTFRNCTMSLMSANYSWINSTNSFSETTSQSYMQLDTTNSLRVYVNSTSFKLAFRIRFFWNATEGAVDVWAIVYDDHNVSASHTETALFTFEDDLDIYSAGITPTNIDPGDGATVSGFVYYQGTTTPPADTSEITVYTARKDSAQVVAYTQATASNGKYTMTVVENTQGQYQYNVYSKTDDYSTSNKTLNLSVGGGGSVGAGGGAEGVPTEEEAAEEGVELPVEVPTGWTPIRAPTLPEAATIGAVFIGAFVLVGLVYKELEQRTKIPQKWRQTQQKLEKEAKRTKWKKKSFFD